MYNDEKKIQIAVCNYLKWKHPQVIFTCAPSGQRRGSKLNRILAGKEAKEMGYARGIPDLMIFKPKEPLYHGLFLEIKTEQGKESSEQKAMIARLNGLSYSAHCCYGYNEAIKTIDLYFEERKSPHCL